MNPLIPDKAAVTVCLCKTRVDKSQVGVRNAVRGGVLAVREDLLERGFQLAYFIFPSRATAVRILSGALNKLKTQRGRETRRAYWRDKYLKRGITRISRNEQDALQWLIFFESDSFEKEQERDGGQTPEEMAVRYIKSLVRMTTAMSSFYVNVGVHRLLHNYTTAEAQRVYETVTERYLGADEYRRAKSVLMGKVERRFGKFLRICRTQYGELRFEASQDQTQWAALADACLRTFTPWSTTEFCPVPHAYGSLRDTLPPQLLGATPENLNHDQVELNRCHAFIDPVCYARLTRALAFDPPERKLALPRFFMENTGNKNNSDDSPQTPPLTPEERKTVSAYLGTEAARRRRAGAQFVTVAVDGAECAGMSLTGETEHAFEIEEGAELLEVRTVDEGKEVVLATHRVSYTESQGIAPSSATVVLSGGRKLLLDISPSPAGEPRRAVVRLSYTPPVLALRRGYQFSLWTWSKYAVAACTLLGAGWVLGANTARDHRQVAQVQPSPSVILADPSFTPQQNSRSKPVEMVLAYKLVPDDTFTRGPGGQDIPSVVVPSHPILLRLDLPVGAEDSRKSLRASLRRFLNPKSDLLSQSLRRSKSSGTTVSFWVPSTVLDCNQDYAVDLRQRTSSGGVEEVSSYTFRTIAEPN
jgi:hypothetical protein